MPRAKVGSVAHGQPDSELRWLALAFFAHAEIVHAETSIWHWHDGGHGDGHRVPTAGALRRMPEDGTARLLACILSPMDAVVRERQANGKIAGAVAALVEHDVLIADAHHVAGSDAQLVEAARLT